MEIKIENLKTKDLDQYKSLIDECFGGSNDIEEYQKRYKEDNESYEIIVAKHEDKIVGSVTIYKIDLFTFSFQPGIEIFNVAVLKDYRRKNIAKILFEYIINFAKENGYCTLFLTCLDDAYSAHRLYENVGFKKTNSLKYSFNINELK